GRRSKPRMFSLACSPVTLITDVDAGVLLSKRTRRLALVTANVSPLPAPGAFGFGAGVLLLLSLLLQPTRGSVKSRHNAAWAREFSDMRRLLDGWGITADFGDREAMDAITDRIRSRARAVIVCFQECARRHDPRTDRVTSNPSAGT